MRNLFSGGTDHSAITEIVDVWLAGTCKQRNKRKVYLRYSSLKTISVSELHTGNNAIKMAFM